MVFELKLPNLGEGITNAEVITVFVAVGDAVKLDQELLEVETGKATMPIPSTVAGKVTELVVAQGASVALGQVLVRIEAVDPVAADVASEAAAPAKPVAPTPAPASNPVAPAPSTPAPQASAPVAAPSAAADASAGEVRAIPASPSVRRLARDFGLNIADISGTGPKGRINVEDVKAFSRQRNTGAGAGVAAGLAKRALPDFSKFGTTRSEAVKGIRKITSQHMSYCWSHIPHVTQYDKADITDLDAQRRLLAKSLPIENGGKLTITSILLKIVAAALRKFPNFNVSYDDTNEQLIFKEYVHIGVAVDTPKGLVVPVIQDVDQKGIAALSGDLGKLSNLARDGKLSAADMQGGSFTISNLGGIGGHAFTPIVNWPEVAILGVSRGEMEPVYIDGAFQPRLRLPLSLSYDHRVIDGADGARFLRWICAALEQPILALT